MTFAEIAQEVYNITARDDLTSLTETAIKAATLKAHKSDFYFRDIYEQTYAFPTADYIQKFDYISIIPNFRALKYARKVATSTNEVEDFFNILSAEEVMLPEYRNSTDIAYVAGRIIELRSSTELKEFILGCYVNPIVTVSGYASWIADLHPYAIVHEAARLVFAAIAQQAESNGQKELVAEAYAELKTEAITNVGY